MSKEKVGSTYVIRFRPLGSQVLNVLEFWSFRASGLQGFRVWGGK